MKHIICMGLFLLVGTLFAQEQPMEVKEEVVVKTLKVKDNEKTTENKVKEVTRETSDVELNESDINKVNQDRLPAKTKVEKTTYIDDNILLNETSYKLDNANYVFSPNNDGFEMLQSNENNQSQQVGKSWATSVKGYYIVDGTPHSGIGYFDQNGNFVTEFYNKDTKQVEVKTYLKK